MEERYSCNGREDNIHGQTFCDSPGMKFCLHISFIDIMDISPFKSFTALSVTLKIDINISSN